MKKLGKICGRCKEYKNHDLFGKDSHTLTGLKCYCLECSRSYAKKIYYGNLEKYRLIKREDKKKRLSENEKLRKKENKKSRDYFLKHPNYRKEWLDKHPNYMKNYHLKKKKQKTIKD